MTERPLVVQLMFKMAYNADYDCLPFTGHTIKLHCERKKEPLDFVF